MKAKESGRDRKGEERRQGKGEGRVEGLYRYFVFPTSSPELTRGSAITEGLHISGTLH